MSTRIKEAASLGPAAGTIHRVGDYIDSGLLSRRKRIEAAAEVLCLLAFFPLSATERVGFVILLGRRLCRAYAGGRS